MSLKRKIVSAILAISMIFGAVSLSGCADVGYVATVDGQKVPAGLYILYTGTALNDARTQLKEEQPDLNTAEEGFDYYAQTVSGVSFGDYVKQKATDYCKRYVAVENMFNELGLSLTSEEKSSLNDSVNYEWEFDADSYSSMLPYLEGYDTLGEYYQSIGVGKSSLKAMYDAAAKTGKIFDYYYGEGGVEEVPAEEIAGWIKDNYALVRYIPVSLRDKDNNIIEDETALSDLEKLAESYRSELADGKSFAEVRAEYDQYVAEQNGEAQNTDTSSSENTEEGKTEEETKQDSDYNTVINKESTSPSEEFVNNVFTMECDVPQVYKTDTNYYVIVRLDITAEEEYIEQYHEAAVNELRGDTLEDVLKEKYAGYSFAENTSVPDYSKEAEKAMQGLNSIATLNYYSQMFGGY